MRSSLKTLAGLVLLVLAFRGQARAAESPSSLTISATSGSWLLLATVEAGKGPVAAKWLKTLRMTLLPVKKSWPAYVQRLDLFEQETQKPGQAYTLTVRRAQALGVLPPVEGLDLSRAKRVLVAEGFFLLATPHQAATSKPAIWLEGTKPNQAVSIWGVESKL